VKDEEQARQGEEEREVFVPTSVINVPAPLASSLYMNIIEEIWRRMKMRIVRRNSRPTKVVELRQVI